MILRFLNDGILNIYKLILTIHYKNAKSAEDLFWYIGDELPDMLVEAVEKRTVAGKALDLGCGTGENAIYLAKNGYEVTAIDFVDEALDIAKKNAEDAGVKIEFIKGDVLKWESDKKYDFILDGGCLHGISPKYLRNIYRERIPKFLAENGELVIMHFGKKHKFDYSPVGPRRVSHEKINQFFKPFLYELSYSTREIKVGFPIGTIIAGSYWFRKK